MIKIFSQRLLDLKKNVLAEAAENFSRVEEISEQNTLKILKAMRRLKISDAHFKTSTGYIILPKKNFSEVSKAADRANLLPVENLRDALKISMPRE